MSSTLNLNPVPTAEELGTVLMESYQYAVECGSFNVNLNLLSLNRRVMDLRITRGQEPCASLRTAAELEDHMTVRLQHQHAAAVKDFKGVYLAEDTWMIYDWLFGGKVIGKGNTEQQAWSDAARKIKAARVNTLAKAVTASTSETTRGEH